MITHRKECALREAQLFTAPSPGSRITNAIWHCRKPINQWQCNFYLKTILPLITRHAEAKDNKTNAYHWFVPYTGYVLVNINNDSDFKVTFALLTILCEGPLIPKSGRCSLSSSFVPKALRSANKWSINCAPVCTMNMKDIPKRRRSSHS